MRHWPFAVLIALILGAAVVFLSPIQLIALVIGITLFVLTFIRPRWVLAFLVLWMPLEPFLLKFVPDGLYLPARYFSEVLVYFFAVVMLVKMVMGRKQWKHTPLDLPFLLFFLTLVISAVLNAVPATTAVLGIRQIIRFIVLFFAVVALYPPREYIRKMTAALLILVIAESILAVTQSLTGGLLDTFLIPSERKFFESIQLTAGVPQFWAPGSRVFATLGRYDILGVFLTFFILLTIGLRYQKELWPDRRELILVLLCGIPALILTASRSAWFGFLLGLVIIGIVLMRSRRLMIGGGGVLVASLILYLVISGVVVPKLIEEPGVQQGVAERFLESFSRERWRSEYYGLGRVYFWVTTPLMVVATRPFFGWGPGQYGGGAAAALGNTRAYDELGIPFGIYGTEGHIDNSWLSLWGETGTVGLALYLWMFVALAMIAYRLWNYSTDPLTRGLALGFLGALAAVTLNAFLATMLEVRTLALYLWLFAAFLVVLGRREKLI